MQAAITRTSAGRLPRIIVLIDMVNRRIGEAAAWLMLPVVVICFAVVVLRYGFGTGYVWMQELFIWINGAAFTMAVGYAFSHDAHVRVDVFYGSAGERAKAWINIFGVMAFLFVMCGVLLWVSFPQIVMSWRLGERSSSMSGLEYAYVLKTFVPIFCVISILHGVSLLTKSILFLRREVDVTEESQVGSAERHR